MSNGDILETMEDSIFTKIIKGEIPCHKVYEDEKTFAFLDIYPVQPGHTLIITKKQTEYVWDLGTDDYTALTNSVKKVALHLREITGKSHVGEVIEGTDVPHAHIHLIPFDAASELRNIPDRSLEPDHEALALIAKKIAF